MELRFDSMAELRDFLALIGSLPSTVSALPHFDEACTIAPATASPSIEFPEPSVAAFARNHVALVEGAPPCPANTEAAAEAETTQRRRRRTKAEMEATRAAEVAPSAAALIAAGEAADAIGTAAHAAAAAVLDAEPVAMPPSENIQAILDAPNQQAAIAAGMAAVQAIEPLVQEDATAAMWIRLRVAELGEMSALDHLSKCRGFIAKHGMAKYNATFGMAGLQPNVMAYSPHDCALHAATLDYCER